MIGEFDIGGVFTPTLLIWAALAFAISMPIRWALNRLGVYRFVWHRGLFDVALVILLWTGVAATAATLTFPT
jgi:hypothetical protein